MSDVEARGKRLAELLKEESKAKRLIGRGHALFFSAAAERAELEGRPAGYFQAEVDRRLKLKTTRISKSVQKKAKKDAPAPAAAAPIPPKDFVCEAQLVTGVACQSPAGAAVVPAASTKHNGKLVATCKACKKSAMKAKRE